MDALNASRVGDVPLPKSIYFGGCSWGAAFYVGVHRAMTERWGDDFYSRTLMSGGSAGTIIAVLIALGLSNKQIDTVYRMLASRSIKEGSIGTGARIVEEVLRDVFERIPNVHEKLSNNIWMGTTSFPWNHRWHCSFKDVDDLMQTMKGSLHIPFYTASFMEILKGEEVVDGAYGFAGLDLLHGDDTLYVGIDPHAEISKELTNHQMLFPNVGATYDDLVSAGYDALMQWDGTMKQKVGFRIPNYQALIALWLMKAIEISLRLFTVYFIRLPYAFALAALMFASKLSRTAVYLACHVLVLALMFLTLRRS